MDRETAILLTTAVVMGLLVWWLCMRTMLPDGAYYASDLFWVKNGALVQDSMRVFSPAADPTDMYLVDTPPVTAEPMDSNSDLTSAPL